MFTARMCVHTGGEALEFECGPDGCDTNGTENRPCFPIKVTKPDRAFNDRRCLMFVRTEGVPALDCKTGEWKTHFN